MKDFIFMFVLFFANTIQTITGFAGNLLAMPVSMTVVGYDSARTVINIFTLVACLWITWQNRQYTQWKVLLKMSVIMLVGMLIGNELLKILELQFLQYIYGAVILLVAIKKLFIKKEFNVPKWLMLLVLCAAGIIHGLFLSGGALAVVYAVSQLKDKNEFRATIAPLWVILDTVLIFFHAQAGLYTPHNLMLIALSLIPMVLSVVIGNMIYKKMSAAVFLKITYILLIISGVSVFL